MNKLSVMAWMSLDGVFDAELMGQWWAPYDSAERAALIQEVIGGADAFVFGRHTYEMLGAYWSAMKNNEMGVADKLNGAPKYVASATLESGSWNNTAVIKNGFARELARLKQQVGNLLVMGSAKLVQSLMAEGVVDEYRFFITPVIVGRGKRFLYGGTAPNSLSLTSTKTLTGGVLALQYRPAT
jgi:dihydrofolate reductase